MFLFLQGLAASPVLHQQFHADAGKADHECVVTVLSQGKVHTTTATPAVSAPASFTTAPVLAPEFVLVAVDYRLLPGRGPPSLLA